MPTTPIPRRRASATTGGANGRRRGAARIGGVQGNQHAVEREAAHGLDQHVGIVVTGEADETNAAVDLRLARGLERAALTEQDVQFIGRPEVVDLPQVQTVGAEPPERVVEQTQRPVAGALVGLRRQEDGIARAGPGAAEGLTIIVLTLLI